MPGACTMAGMAAISETLVPDGRLPRFEWALVDGSFRHVDDTRISVHAHALSYGTGTFEGLRATWNEAAQEL